MRSHFKHSVDLVDREGDRGVLVAVEDFLLAKATYEAAKTASGRTHRLSQEARILEDSTRRRED
jgi:hypothetical protein